LRYVGTGRDLSVHVHNRKNRNREINMKSRKANRLKGYDYSKDNLYFITSCVKNMECCFGDVVSVGTGSDLSEHNPDKINPDNNDEIEAEMILNEFGIIANNQLEWLENQYAYIHIHSYIVMPNHIHAILEIDSNLLNVAHNLSKLTGIVKIKSLSQIMGAYKTTSSKFIHEAGYDDFAWHRSFYDHIIRDEKSYLNIVNYIENNPNTWYKDKFYKK
jgi:putative transposase